MVVDQANCLEELGYAVDVLVILPSLKQGFYEDLKLSQGKLINIDAKGFSLHGIWLIAKLIKGKKYEAIISHLFLANTLVRLACLLAFRFDKIIAYEHNSYGKEKSFKHFFIDRLLSFLTHKIVAVSEEVKDYLIEKGISKHKIVVVQNGISEDFIKNIPAADDVRGKLGFSEKDILAVSNGNVNPQKGYETLIAAVGKVVDENPRIHFLICGSDTNEYSRFLKKQAALSPYADHVHFLGARHDAKEIVNCADIYVMPSLWEGLSLSLLEALMLGKIVVVSEIPGMTALVRDGYNGFTFKTRNAEQLAKIITFVIKHPADFQSQKSKAKETGKLYTIEKCVWQLVSLIN